MERTFEQPGFERAVAALGEPVARAYQYAVSADTHAYWSDVLRKRSAEVVLVVSCHPGRYLVHTKAFYPRGTYRLLSGGLRPGEDLMTGARRELAEETGLMGRLTRFLGVQTHRFVHEGATLRFCSYVVAVDADGACPVAADDDEQITSFREVDHEGLRHVAEGLERMEPAWIEWGRFRATAHWLVWELLGREGGGDG